jgi:hypothetical protein
MGRRARVNGPKTTRQTSRSHELPRSGGIATADTVIARKRP